MFIYRAHNIMKMLYALMSKPINPFIKETEQTREIGIKNLCVCVFSYSAYWQQVKDLSKFLKLLFHITKFDS